MQQLRTRRTSTEEARAGKSAVSTRDFGPGSALDSRIRSLAEARFGVGLGGVSVHTGSDANEVTARLGARAVTIGDRIAFGRWEYGPGTSNGDRLLAHEIAHVVQQREPRSAVGDHVPGDAERDANRAATDLLDPHPTPSGNRIQGPLLRTGRAVHMCPAGSAGCAETSTSDAAQPLVSLQPETTPATTDATQSASLTCEAEAPGICEMPQDTPFDPDMIDVPGMRNDNLNHESLRIDKWWDENALMSPAHPEREKYERYRQRLKDERSVRVRNGHLWMTTAIAETPTQLYMLVAGEGLSHVVTANVEAAMDVPRESFPGPIMTPTQFEEHLTRLGVPDPDARGVRQASPGGGR